jgi:hypothetical protein
MTNVSNITDKQPQAQCHFVVNVILRGFPVAVEFDGRAGDLRAIIDRLLEHGAEPPTTLSNKSDSGLSGQTSDDAPVCEFHGKMKRSNHGGWFCSRKMGDGSYCKSKA